MGCRAVKKWYVHLSCESGNTCHEVVYEDEDEVNGSDYGCYFECATFTEAKEKALKLNYESLRDVQSSIKFVKNQRKSDFV